MDITWYGQTSFHLKERKNNVLLDPYGKMGKFKVDIVALSQSDYDYENISTLVDDKFRIIDRPGEYEISGIFVTGVYMPHNKAQSESRNNIIVVYIDNLVICHLGLLDHVPHQDQIENLGNIDILMIPVGGQPALNASQAAEVISLIEPKIVIPMYYCLSQSGQSSELFKTLELFETLDSVDKFLKELGLANIETVDVLKITQSQLPEETQIVLLEPKQ
jgi:L-ascorbate metabolism protein UlaG (beta-lactamase superfamily)